MKILVTGGAGFIGSNLVDGLITLGHQVIVIDNLVKGKRENLNPAAKFFELDIKSPEISEIMQQEYITHIYHLAAQTDVQHSLKNPVDDALNNILGTVNLLDSSQKCGVKKIIYSSSAAVYGQPTALPMSEEHKIEPISPYGLSKYVCEAYLILYQILYGLNYTIFRYANVYGPRQEGNGEGGVISIFLNKLLKREQPLIYGDGEQTRDFIYVQDIVKASIAALSQGDKEIFNISSGQRISINQLVEVVGSLLDTDLQPIYVSKRPGDIEHSCLDNSKAKRLLNWQPETEIYAGLKQTLEYYSGKI